MVETPHTWQMLDRMRETQITHGAHLRELLEGQRSASQILSELHKRKGSGLTTKLSGLSRPIVVSAVNYAIGLLMMAHILRGGSILDILKLLLPS